MSGAEETTPIVNPLPAVVPSPDDSAKEITGQDEGVEERTEEVKQDVEDIEEEKGLEELKMEEPIDEDDMVLGDMDITDDSAEPVDAIEEAELPDKVEDSGPAEEAKQASGEQSAGALTERLDSIDPSYNPNGEELLYEGDMESEAPTVKADNKDVGAQDEGFIVSVHDTGMELDMTESMTTSTITSGSSTVTTTSGSSTVATSGSGVAKSPQCSRHSSDSGGAKSSKTAPSAKSGAVTGDSKKADKSTTSPTKSADRFVD